MIEKIVRLALQQRLLILIISVVLLIAGLIATKRLSVDAFPDVTNVQVQIASEAPGRSPEEVERFVTIPIELSMTGLPGLVEMRSLNRNGISIVTLVFTEKTDVYFARQLVLERLIEAASRMPIGVVPVLAPLSTGLGEVYQYTLEHANDGNRELSEENARLRARIDAMTTLGGSEVRAYCASPSESRTTAGASTPAASVEKTRVASITATGLLRPWLFASRVPTGARTSTL